MTQQQYIRFINARRSYIEKKYSHLNSEQRRAVLTTEGPLLLLAGAGSGKTTVLVNRIANLIRYGRGSDSTEVPDFVTAEDVNFLENLIDPVSETDQIRADFLCAVEPVLPWNILAVTFTNKAADEMKSRLCDMSVPDGDSVWAMTFHSACCRILRSNIDRLGYAGSFTIYDTSDSERLMKSIIKDMGLDDKTFPAKYVLSVISKEKDNMVSAEDYYRRAEDGYDVRVMHIAKAYKKYQDKLRENNALDFDDIIFLTVKLLQEHEDVRTYYQKKFRYVLVDEYQDTNHMQYLLTSILAGGYENICVVGDDDQSIYRFRGATIENILSFEKQYTASRAIRLEQNYRSTQAILNAANAVIQHNKGRKGKVLWTDNEVGDLITVYEASDEGAEANYVAGQIMSASRDSGFKDHAILYRTNAQSNALEYAFKRNGIPYRIVGGTRFFERAEIKDMLSYLCVINNRNDDLRLHRIINNPPRGLGAKTIEVADRLAQAEGSSLYRIVSDPYSYAPLEKAAGKLMQFTVMLEGLAQLLDTDISLADFYEEVMLRTGYIHMLQSKPTEENMGRLENIRELKSSILTYMQNDPAPTLSGFLEEVALYTDIEEYNSGDDAVVMMTMHSAKGLEFPNVYLVGLEDGLFPGLRAIGEVTEMEEERRLCYVAITRAKKKLTLSYARQRMLYGRTNASLPSRFLKEIPEKLVQRKGAYRTPDFGYRSAPSHTPTYHTPSFTNNYTIPSQKPQATILDLNKGDMVNHTAFGRGMVLSVMKMGGDALWEIAFDKIGTKKLMGKTASAHMKKL